MSYCEVVILPAATFSVRLQQVAGSVFKTSRRLFLSFCNEAAALRPQKIRGCGSRPSLLACFVPSMRLQRRS
jgi:predicted membrane metal-binding protein